jgi:DNA-binding IclR family transcriptional regulator
MHRLLDLARPDHAGEVQQFLTELPEISARRLAFNRGVTLPDAFTVATPLLAPDGSSITTISAAVGASEADHLDGVREECPADEETGSLQRAVATLGPKYGLDGS